MKVGGTISSIYEKSNGLLPLLIVTPFKVSSLGFSYFLKIPFSSSAKVVPGKPKGPEPARIRPEIC